MWGRNCRDACRDRNKREYRKVSPRQWWQPGSQDSEHDSQDSIRMRWKKNRKSRLGLGLEAEAGAPIKSAGEASEALLAIGLRSSTGAAYRSRRDASGKLLPGEDFVARRKAAQAAT